MISLLRYITNIFISKPEKIPGNILKGVFITGQSSLIDNPIILNNLSPSKIESKAPGVFSFLEIALATSNSGEMRTSIASPPFTNRSFHFLSK